MICIALSCSGVLWSVFACFSCPFSGCIFSSYARCAYTMLLVISLCFCKYFSAYYFVLSFFCSLNVLPFVFVLLRIYFVQMSKMSLLFL